MKRIKPPVRFTASLPAMICGQVRHQRVSKKIWDTLPPDGRDYYIHQTRPKGYNQTVYQRVTPIPPYENPKTVLLRSRLKARRVKWIEQRQVRRDVEYINFSTITGMTGTVSDYDVDSGTLTININPIGGNHERA